jgi:hypothetical protein
MERDKPIGVSTLSPPTPPRFSFPLFSLPFYIFQWRILFFDGLPFNMVLKGRKKIRSTKTFPNLIGLEINYEVS